MFKRTLFLFAGLCIMFNSVFSQSPYEYKSRYLPGTFSTIENGMMGLINPANTFYNRKSESRTYWSNSKNSGDNYSFGQITGFKGLSFGMFREKIGDFKVNDYSLAFGGGTETFSTGVMYGWSSGDRAAMQRKTYTGFGLIWRPTGMFTIGGVYNVTTNSLFQSYALDAGIRPFKNKRVTIFGGTNFDQDDKFEDFHYRYGAKLEIFNGLGVIASMDDQKIFNLGFNISLGIMSSTSFTNYDKNGNSVYNTGMIRIGGMEKSTIYDKLYANKLLKMELKGRVGYRGYKLFKSGSKRFYEIIKTIDNSAKSPQVKVLALNFSGLSVGAENAWEIRKALKNFKKSGKKLIIYIDRADMTIYHLASVADLLVLDKEGQLFLKGYVMTRTYFKGTLEKMGLAFDEWRFFKYKSAVESLSRESMSEADREQRQKFLDDLYLTVKSDIVEKRKLTAEQFDEVINENVIVLPEMAQEKGMVDFLGRWSKIDKIIEDYMGEKPLPVPAMMVNQYMAVDENWGEEPEIAVVYVIGACSMDSGINARKLEKQLLKLSKATKVKAIVLRVDSPGGDALASDLVAEAIKTCKKNNKPVIVSQGSAAASGGYWISMYADSIYASPITITASIGVIGGWLYNNGLTEKMGLTSDLVKVGNHADIGSGPSIPFLGQVPARNLSEDERGKMSNTILSMYKSFVRKVADGRGLEYDHVQKHAQGRIYSGLDGHKFKLIDKLGGLQDAIESAKKAAGLRGAKNVEVVEYGKYLGLFPMPSFIMFSAKQQFKLMDPVTEYYLTYPLNNPFRPVPMVNPESIKVQ